MGALWGFSKWILTAGLARQVFLASDKMVLYVAVCTLLGSIGSYTAMRRHLRL